MYDQQEFELISKALFSTEKSLENQVSDYSDAILQLGQAKEDMMRALSVATSIDHQLIIESLFDKEL
ncbi:hypothetical protein KDJ21_014960 [Metabacillus litoralis]|uniref:hypothetical protein n=1 Tax=Metabacillus TaxID=2675233 RepID=UPI000EF5BE0C|nr:hypothetical protein [Metabacillus litoralis]MCM3163045.1 hypothetical protein [Metabacillus litoralis]MCM3410751.1 hypothetical protein [Metabacillus litoralis]UHA58163.1 hypothetical protein KDJ21_014960 [Metabacillus litoralis]